MSNVTKALYKCTMAVLYVICKFGWNLYLKYWKTFATINDQYTEEYGLAALKAIEAAKAMPDVSQRRGTSTNSKSSLEVAAEKGVLYWKRMERLLVKAIPKKDRKAALQLAGGDHYAKAAKGEFAEVSLLLVAGADFISKNMDALTKAGMPQTFADDYNIAIAGFEKLHADYGETKVDVSDDSKDKIQTNNDIHAALTDMLEDAQTLFEDDLSIRKQFTFTSLRKMVTKDVVSGIHFTIRDKGNSKPLSLAVITADEEKEGSEVNGKGVLDKRFSKGVHTVTVVCPGYVSYTGEVTVDTGIMHRVEIKLVKEEAAPAQKGDE